LPSLVEAFGRFPGPAVHEVIIDPDAGVYPMVGPGLSYAKMITGDYIKSREKPADDRPGPSEMF
jgi:acetolactate synthase-1/2/3 large subunit